MSSISEGTPYNLGFACLEARVSSDRREGWSSQKGGALQDRGGRSDGPERGPGIHTCSGVVGGDPAGFGVLPQAAQERSPAILQDAGCCPRPLISPRGTSLPSTKEHLLPLVCLWVPPSHCLSPSPRRPSRHSQEGPWVGCSFAPEVNTAWCCLGGPGSAVCEPRE